VLQSGEVTVRSALGCWLHERWRAECALRSPLSRATGITWVDLHNRNEQLGAGGDGDARACLFKDSSSLTVARVFPRVGWRLLQRAAGEWPFALGRSRGHEPPRGSSRPDASVIMPVAGRDRRPQFDVVLRSLFAQSLASLEVVVVEHSQEPEFRASCPEPVQYVHLKRAPGQAFNKSLAFNAGARAARGRVLILQDADLVVPRNYLESAIHRIDAGWDGLQPERFRFYLDEPSTAVFGRGDGDIRPLAVTAVGQNIPGGSTVVTSDAYWAIGGSDERFDERGGDDNDFLDRLRTRRFFAGGYAPAIHLWHPVDPTFRNRPDMQRFKDSQLQKPPHQRIQELQQAQSGVQITMATDP
jgi:Glycosyl transferase family 2